MSNRIRFWEVWTTLQTRLSSTRMLTVLQKGKVYIEGSDYSKPEGLESAFWGRLVLVPAMNPWLDSVGIGPTRSIRFVTRAESHAGNSVSPIDVQKMLDGVQDECTVLLERFVIPRMTYVMGALPLWLARPQLALPEWDNDRGLYYSEAEWRGEVASP